MSNSADPQALVEFDARTVNGQTIPLKARYLTWRERKRLNELVAKIEGQLVDDPGVLEAAEEAIKIGIVTPFESLEPLTARELCTLAVTYRHVTDLTEAQRGKSTSLLRSTAGKSAQDAAMAAATSPANKAP